MVIRTVGDLQEHEKPSKALLYTLVFTQSQRKDGTFETQFMKPVKEIIVA